MTTTTITYVKHSTVLNTPTMLSTAYTTFHNVTLIQNT